MAMKKNNGKTTSQVKASKLNKFDHNHSEVVGSGKLAAQVQSHEKDIAWLDEAQQVWESRQKSEQELSDKQAKGERVVQLADASDVASVLSDAGQSLIVADASGSNEKSKAADKPVDEHRGEDSKYLLPLLLIGAGVGVAAAAGGGGGGGGGVSSNTIRDGFVFDELVKNAIVFRDSDGDGMWLDVDQDGQWDAGDESILSTNDNGQFIGLGGEGLIVAASVDRLVTASATGVVGRGGVRTGVVQDDLTVVTTQVGTQVSGDAIDFGADNILGTADDFVWSGSYVAPGVVVAPPVTSGNTTTETIWVTGVSTLTAAYLRAQGIEDPTQQQVVQAADDLAKLIVSSFGDAVQDGGEAVDFFKSDANKLITKLMGAIAGIAEATGQNVNDLVNQALDNIANIAAEVFSNGLGQPGGTGDGLADGNFEQFDLANRIDLTDPNHIREIFDFGPEVAGAIANQISAPGPAIYTLFVTDSSEVQKFELAAVLGEAQEGNVFTIDPNLNGVDAFTYTIPADFDPTDLTALVAAINAWANDQGIQPNPAVTFEAYDDQEPSQDLLVLTWTVAGDQETAFVGLEIDGERTEGLPLYDGSTDGGNGGDVDNGGPLGNIVVLSQNQSADVNLNLTHDPAVTLQNSLILVNAAGNSSDATLNLDPAVGSVSGITVKSTGEDSDASADITFNGDLNGDISVLSEARNSSAGLDLNGNARQTEVQKFELAAVLGEAQEGNVFTIDPNLNGVEPFTYTIPADFDPTDLAALEAAINAWAIDQGIQPNPAVTFEAYDDQEPSQDLLVLTWTVAGDQETAFVGLEIDGERTEGLPLYVGSTDGNDDQLILNDTNINVIASGDSSDAYINLDTAAGVVGDITIKTEAGASDSSAEAYLRLEATIGGDITVQSLGNNSNANAEIVGANTQQTFDLRGLVNGVQAGSVFDVTVNGEVILSYTFTSADQNNTQLAIANLVSAIQAQSSAENYEGPSVRFVNLDSTLGYSADEEVGIDAYADMLALFWQGQVEYAASVSLTNGDNDPNLFAEISEREDVLVLDNTNITVSASGNNSEASIDISYITGEVGSAPDTHENVDTAEVNLLAAIRAEALVVNALETEEALAEAQAVLSGLVDPTDEQLAEAEAAVDSAQLAYDLAQAALVVDLVDIADSLTTAEEVLALAQAALEGLQDPSDEELENAELAVADARAEIMYITSKLELSEALQSAIDSVLAEDLSLEDLSELGSATLAAAQQTRDALVHTFELAGAQSDRGGITVQTLVGANSADAIANIVMDGAVLNGDIVVHAAGEDSLASADIASPTLNDSNIVVTASGEGADANLELTAYGTIGQATTFIQNLAAARQQLEAATLAITAAESAYDSALEAYESEPTDANFDLLAAAQQEKLLAQDLRAAAELHLAHAESIAAMAGAQTANGGIVVQTLADAQYSRAEANIQVLGTINPDADVIVRAAGVDSYAELRLELNGDYSNREFFGEDVVNATGEYSEARLYIDGKSGGELELGERTFIRDTAIEGAENKIYVNNANVEVNPDASREDIGIGAIASAVNAETRIDLDAGPDGSVTLNNINILVDASATNSNAYVNVYGAEGTINNIEVNASGDELPPNHIDDGYDDAYDSGNYISSQFAQNIPYWSEPQSNAFGAESQTVAEFNSGIFAMFVTGNLSDTFDVSGNLGADGGGEEDQFTLATYNGYQAIVQRTFNANDPSINRVFIYKADASVSALTIDGETEDDDFNIEGLASVERFAYTVIYGDSDAAKSQEALEAYFHAFVDSVMLDEQDNDRAIAEMKVAFNQNFDVISAPLGNLVQSFEALQGEVNSNARTEIDFSGDVAGDITVNAMGANTNASVDIYGQINFVDTNITVTVAGQDADGYVEISDADGSIGHGVLDADRIYNQTVNGGITAQVLETSGDVGEAEVRLDSYNGTIAGDLVAIADGYDANAYININRSDSNEAIVTLNDVNVFGDAGGIDADTRIRVYDTAANSGINDITLIASGDGSETEASIELNGTVNGDIELLASGDAESISDGSNDYDGAELDLYGNFAFDDTNITVTVSGGDGEAVTEAVARIRGATGEIGHDVLLADRIHNQTGNGGITAQVLDSSVNGSALVSIDFDGTLNGDIVVHADGVSSDANVNINVDQPSTSEVILNDVNIDIHAGGDDAYASANIEGIAEASTVVNINVEASGDGSEASLDLEFNGDVKGDITVLASGNTIGGDGGEGEIQGYEFFDQAPLTSDDVLSMVVFGQTLTYAVTSEDVLNDTGFINAFNAFQTQANNLNLNLAINDFGPYGPGLWILYGEDGNQPPVQLLRNNQTIPLVSGSADVGMSWVEFNGFIGGGDNANADLNLVGSVNFSGNDVDISIESTGLSSNATANINASGNIDDITLTAGGIESLASLDLEFAGNINGDIDVAASGTNSDASLDMYGNLVFVDSNITVTASGNNAQAEALVRNGSGTIGHAVLEMDRNENQTVNGGITAQVLDTSNGGSALVSIDFDGALDGDVVVYADGSYSNANVNINIPAGSLSEIELQDVNIDIHAGGEDAYASANIQNVATGSTVVNIDVTAGGYSAEADLNFNMNGTVTGNITVTASGDGAEGYLNLNNNTTDVVTLQGSDISVIASGDGSYTSAEADIDASGTVDQITVTASGNNAEADLDLDMNGAVTGTILVTASGDGAEAYLDLNSNTTDVLTIGTSQLGSDISVLASGENSEASADIVADGYIDDITVTASTGRGSYASLDLDFDGEVKGDINVTASSIYSDAEFDMQGNVKYVNTNVTLTASGASSDINVDLRNTAANSSIVNIDVTAGGYSAEADLNFNMNGTVTGNITVTASGDGAEGYLNLNNNTTDVVTLQGSDISVIASGDGSYTSAEADIDASGTVDQITVTASGNNAEADLDLDMNGAVTGTILVTASGDGAEGYLNLYNNAAQNNAVTLGSSPQLGSDITVAASGDGSSTYAEAYIDAVGNIDQIAVIASGTRSDSYLDLEFVGDIHGDITVTAGEDDYGWSNFDLTLDGKILGNITATASGYGSYASIDIENFDNSSATYQYVDLTPLVNAIITIQNEFNTLRVTNVAAMIDDPTLRPSVSLTINGQTFTHTFDAYELEYDPADDLHDENNVTDAIRNAWDNIYDQMVAAHKIDPLAIPFTLNGQLDGQPISFPFDFAETNVSLPVRLDMYWDSSFGDVPPATISWAVNGGQQQSLNVLEPVSGIEYRDIQLGSNTVNVDLTASATAESAEAHINIDNAFGYLGNITANAWGDGTEASVEVDFLGTITGNITAHANGDEANASIIVGISSDLEGGTIADTTPVQVNLGRISVIAEGGYDAEASVQLYDINGNICSDVNVEARSRSADANLDLNYHGVIGGDITVLASGGSADASLDIVAESSDADTGMLSISLTSADVAVTASGYSAEARLTLTDATGVISSLAVNATGLGSVASAEIDFTGTLLNGISVVADAGPAHQGWGEDESWESTSASLVMSAGRLEVQSISNHDLFYGFANRFASDNINNQFETPDQSLAYVLLGDVISLNVDGVKLNVTIDQDYDYTQVSQFASYMVTELNEAIAAYNVLNPQSALDLTVIEDTEQPNENNWFEPTDTVKLIWNTAGNHEEAYFTSSIWSNKVSLETYFDGRNGDAILLANENTQDIKVWAEQGSDEAYLNIDNLSGTVDTLSIRAVGTSSDATAKIRFDQGGIEHTQIVAGSQTATVNLHISQTEKSNTLYVGGDGEVNLQLVDKVVTNIDLDDLRDANPELPIPDANDMHAVWGAFNLDLMTPDVVIPGNDPLSFNANRIVIGGFDENKDSINVNLPANQYYSQLANNWLDWTTSSADAGYRYWMSTSTDATFGGYQAWNIFQDGLIYESEQEFISAAQSWYAISNDPQVVGYYYAMVDKDGDGPGGAIGMLAYGFGEDGVNGIIELPDNDNWLDERAVADVHAMHFGYSDQQNHTETFIYNDTHAISSLSFSNALAHHLNNESDVNLDLIFQNARIDEIVMDVYSGWQTGYDYGEYEVDITGGCNDIWLRQSNISIEVHGRSAASLRFESVEGSITALNLVTTEDGEYNGGSIDVDFRNADVVINDITLRALQDNSSIDLRLDANPQYAGESNYEFDRSVIDMRVGEWKHGSTDEVDNANLTFTLEGGEGYIQQINMITAGSSDNNDLELDLRYFSGDLGDINLISNNYEAWDNQIDASIRLTGVFNGSASKRIDNGVQDIGDIVMRAGYDSDIKLVIDGTESGYYATEGCVDIHLDNTDITISAANGDATAVLLLNSGSLDYNNFTAEINTTSVIGSLGDISISTYDDYDVFGARSEVFIGGASNLSFNDSVIDVVAESDGYDDSKLTVSGTTQGTIESIRVRAFGNYSSYAVGSDSTVIIDSFSGQLGDDDVEGTNSINVSANNYAVATLTVTGDAQAPMTLNEGLNIDVTSDNSGDAYLTITNVNDTLSSLSVSAYDDARSIVSLEISGGIDTTLIAASAWDGDALVELDITQNVTNGDVYVTGGSSDPNETVFLTYHGATAETIYVGWDNAQDFVMNGYGPSGFNNHLAFNLSIMDMVDSDTVDQTSLLANMLTVYGFRPNGSDSDTISFKGIATNYAEGSNTFAGLSAFLTAADSAIGAGGGYYFGIVDDDGDLGTIGSSGYLAMDEDATGLSMLVNFADINSYSAFDSQAIYNYNLPV